MKRSLKILLAVLLLSISGRAYTQVDTIVWQQLSPLPDTSAGLEQGYFLIDSDFYVVGGLSPTEIPTNKVWKYHIPTDTWIQLANLPFGASESGGSFVINGKGYFLTSYDSLKNGNCDNAFFEFNPIGEIWTQKTSFPDSPRQNSSSFSYQGNGYVAFTGGCQTDDNHLWEYNPSNNLWTQLMSLPPSTLFEGHCGRAVALSSDSINAAYFIGGLSGANGSIIGDFWRYNFINDGWDSLGQMPGGPRAFPLMWGFDSVLIGGGGTNYINLLNDFYIYNILKHTWNPVVFKNSFDSTGVGWGTFIYDKRAYYFGGWSSLAAFTFSNKMWSFDASKYIHDKPTGISPVTSDETFKLYPNPIKSGQGFAVSASEDGEIVFYDALGRVIDERKLQRGVTQIRLSVDDEVIFYRVSLVGGEVRNGKVVFLR